jgi:tetratricopeptide (TPR) repeat protein
MYLCISRDDKACAADWGNRWLNELDARRPANDEERSAIDIARVENVQTYGDPKRILPALIASEQAMPDGWNASLRVAQMESAVKNYDETIAACDRGLARKAGPAGRAWLLRIKADAFGNKGQPAAARQALEEALTAAEAIPNPQTRESNVKTIKAALEHSRDNQKN